MRGPQEKGRKKPHPVTCMIDMGEEQERETPTAIRLTSHQKYPERLLLFSSDKILEAPRKVLSMPRTLFSLQTTAPVIVP